MFKDKVLTRPPVGIVQREAPGFIDWAPGDGYAYRLMVNWLSGEMHSMVGGGVLISIENRHLNTFTSYAGNPHEGGVYTIDFISKKFRDEKNDSLYYVTALINWAIYGVNSIAGKYAQGLYDKARYNWQS